jgi:hypothetical protein
MEQYIYHKSVLCITRLWAEQERNWGSISGKSKRLYLLYSVQTGFGAHPVHFVQLFFRRGNVAGMSFQDY